MKKRLLLAAALVAALLITNISTFAATPTSSVTSTTVRPAKGSATQTIIITVAGILGSDGNQNVDVTMPFIQGPVMGGSFICKTSGIALTGGTPVLTLTLDPAEGTIGDGKFVSESIAVTTPPATSANQIFETIAKGDVLSPGGIWKTRFAVSGTPTTGAGMGLVCTITARLNI